MISLALLVGLLGVVPAVSGVLFILTSRWLPRLAAAIWCGLVLLFSLIVVLFFVSLLTIGETIQATAFLPGTWLQLSYQIDDFNIFSALVIGVLASAVAIILIAVEPAQARPAQQGEQQAEEQGCIGHLDRTRQAGVLLICLGAVFTLIFANSALWLAFGWGLACLTAFTLYIQGQTSKRAIFLLTVPIVSAIALYLVLLPAITTYLEQRLDLLNGLGREPLWAAILLLLALLAPGGALLAQQVIAAKAPPRPASMARLAAFALMASPATFTAFSRLALLIAGPGIVAPGTGSTSWQAFSLITVWTVAALALAASILALRHAERASLPLFLSIQLLNWMFAGIAVTGVAALNGALLFKLLRFLALGALLLAGGRKPGQPILSISWWLAALTLGAFPFFAGFSGAWLITSNAIAAGPAWVAGTGISWFALLLVTLAIVRAGGKAPAMSTSEAPPGATSGALSIPGFLTFVLALLALATSIAPEVVVNFFTSPAASALPVISSSAAAARVQTSPLGLTTGAGPWLPGLFWLLALVLLALLLLIIRHERQPAGIPPFLGGEASAGRQDDTMLSSAPDAQNHQAPEAASQPVS
jgi:formate hydrogenlyase subunit 3/multisubunit Na+/H+ antiporter MnhD subunit